MSNSVQSVQALNPVSKNELATPAAKPQQAPTPTAAPHDTVTISAPAKQALAANARPAGDPDHDGK